MVTPILSGRMAQTSATNASPLITPLRANAIPKQHLLAVKLIHRLITPSTKSIARTAKLDINLIREIRNAINIWPVVLRMKSILESSHAKYVKRTTI